jgi:hypothetical protein
MNEKDVLEWLPQEIQNDLARRVGERKAEQGIVKIAFLSSIILSDFLCTHF